MQPSPTFRADHRRGLRGRLGPLRAVVTDDRGREILVRSPEVADVVTSVLNARPTDSHPAHSSSRVVRYSAVHARHGTTLIVSDDRGRDKGVLAPGVLGRTSDRDLAERGAERLNEIDPAVLKPPPRRTGLGWW
jgi:hypothetical protein